MQDNTDLSDLTLTQKLLAFYLDKVDNGFLTTFCISQELDISENLVKGGLLPLSFRDFIEDNCGWIIVVEGAHIHIMSDDVYNTLYGESFSWIGDSYDV